MTEAPVEYKVNSKPVNIADLDLSKLRVSVPNMCAFCLHWKTEDGNVGVCSSPLLPETLWSKEYKQSPIETAPEFGCVLFEVNNGN